MAKSETLTPAEARKIVTRLAISMFRAEASGEKKAPDERKSAWVASKADYLKRASALYRVLKREGMHLTAPTAAEPEAF